MLRLGPLDMSIKEWVSQASRTEFNQDSQGYPAEYRVDPYL